MRATSPSGRVEYEGRVNWSGELGFGVRPPERGQGPSPYPQAEGLEPPPEPASLVADEDEETEDLADEAQRGGGA